MQSHNTNDENTRLLVERNAILDSIPFAAWLKDKDGKFIYANTIYEDIAGISKANMVGKTVFDFLPYEIANTFHQEDLKVIEKKQTIHFQTRRENGWYATVKSPIINSEGEVIGTFGFERNISDNIETLNSLKHERDLMHSLMDNSPDLIYFKDTSGRYVRINKAKALNMGLDETQMAHGKTDADFYSEAYAKEQDIDDKKVIETGQSILGKEELLTQPDGTSRWYSTSKSPIFNENGKIEGLIGISRDISEKRKVNSMLEQERNFLQVLMDNIPYTIYLKDPQGHFTKINKAQAKLLGVEDANEAIGKTDFDFFPQTVAETAFQDEQELLNSGKPMISKLELLKDAENNTIWVEATKIPVKDREGNIIGIVGMSIDITEKRLAEERLRKAKEKAEESDMLKTAFLANMSHEIRTPMNGIIGFSNLLRNPDLTDIEREEFLNHITSCGNTLLNLIDDIIDISKIEAGQIKIRMLDCNLNNLMDEIFESFEASRIKENKNEIKLICTKSLPNEDCNIVTDPFRLRQIISNLIGNALKFTFKGSIEFGYEFLENKTIQFHVKDTGIGIPKDKQKIIFERFGQVIDSNFFINQKGTGLGLAISSNLTRLLGGSMWVDSEPGQGACFYFNIPYFAGKSSEKPLPNSIHNLNITNIAFPKDKVILIAEDEDYNYLYLSYILNGLTENIIWAKNGQEAVDAVRNNANIAIVLIDCKMPVKDGYTAMKEIKSLRPELPVIAQTAFAMADEMEKAIEAGCDGYITKPIQIDVLLGTLNNFINK
ncbi:MAG TPA: PAS domain-containing protein [Bacteroidales bacterium]|nr:PAS domain-containing protein [Bacteroidales bacterium]